MSLTVRITTIVILSGTLGACSGTTTTASFSTLKVWSDGAGVARGESSDGSTAYFLTPYVVDVVAAANAEDDPSALNKDDFPVSTVSNGYEFREGTIEGVNTIIATPVSGVGGELGYVYGPDFDMIIARLDSLGAVPSGTFNYNGVYAAAYRPSGWKEIGTLALAANFNNGTFTINASGNDTSLTGSGFVNTSNGQMSGSGFVFNDVDFGSYSATVVGGVGGANAEGVAGVFYTTEDSNPAFAGAFAGQR